MTQEEIDRLSLPELVALSRVLLLAIAAGEKAAKANVPFVSAILGDGDAVAVTMSIDVERPETAAK
ncbi:hypothetical protein EYE35_21080 [Cereibacter sphaeroides]|nr:hypothetical protein EYE35_21080 [Cereibacter sphaeroides]RDS94079.1 hypothetical protein DWF04_16205 [Cereibacter sphaeroides f. sp. denitrificans]